MDVRTLIPILLKVSIMLTVFTFGLRATVGDALHLFRRPGVLFRSVLAMFIIMPIIAVTLALVFDLHPAIKIALITLSVSPIPPILPKKLFKAGGDEGFVIGTLVALAVLSIAFIPLALGVFESVFKMPLSTTAMSIAKIVATTVLAPLFAGMIVRSLLGAHAPRVAKTLLIIATLMLLCGIVPVLFVMFPAIRALVGNGTVLVFAVFALLALFIGHILGVNEHSHRSVLGLASAARHPGIALSIAHANFPNVQETLPAVFLYLLVSAIVTAPYVARRKKQIAAGAAPVRA